MRLWIMIFDEVSSVIVYTYYNVYILAHKAQIFVRKYFMNHFFKGCKYATFYDGARYRYSYEN